MTRAAVFHELCDVLQNWRDRGQGPVTHAEMSTLLNEVSGYANHRMTALKAAQQLEDAEGAIRLMVTVR